MSLAGDTSRQIPWFIVFSSTSRLESSRSVKDGAPGRNRTCCLAVRSRTLCPVSYRRRPDDKFTRRSQTLWTAPMAVGRSPHAGGSKAGRQDGGRDRGRGYGTGPRVGYRARERAAGAAGGAPRTRCASAGVDPDPRLGRTTGLREFVCQEPNRVHCSARRAAVGVGDQLFIPIPEGSGRGNRL